VISSLDNSYCLPLYLYPEQKTGELFSVDDDGSAWPLSVKGRRPNLNPQFVQDMAEKLGLEFITDGTGDLQATFGPEDIFAYAYAIFHSPAYRERYAEFLKIDFPRLPLTGDSDLFRTLVERGVELIDLHLMRSPALTEFITTYPADGNNEVASGHPRYTEADQRIWINPEQYFAGVPPEVWEFYVGGYQVLDKWLKDRRGRTLSYDEIRHYQRIVIALRETIRLMDEIDEAIPSWPLE
jgi:predicted helicase